MMNMITIHEYLFRPLVGLNWGSSAQAVFRHLAQGNELTATGTDGRIEIAIVLKTADSDLRDTK